MTDDKVQILPADPLTVRTINFKVFERIGTPLRSVKSVEVANGFDWDPVFERLTNRKDMKDGMSVLIWLGHDEAGRDHWRTEIVTEDPTGHFCIKLADKVWRVVEFVEEDGKGEWRATGTVNARGLERLELNP